jgi:hypothetical protein
MTITAGDAEAYRKLAETLQNHRGDTEAWGRVGELLRVQRQLLDRRYANRRVFADERGLNYKAVYDLERAGTAGRTDFTLDTILTLADGYGVTPDSLGAALEGGDLKQALEPPHLFVVPPLPNDEEEAVQFILRGDYERYPEFSAGITAAINTHVPGIRDAVERAARAEAGRRGVRVLDVLLESPPGAAVFPGDAEYARLWDEWRAMAGPAGLRFSVAQLIYGAALRRVQDEVRAQQAGGTASALAPPVR